MPSSSPRSAGLRSLQLAATSATLLCLQIASLGLIFPTCCNAWIMSPLPTMQRATAAGSRSFPFILSSTPSNDNDEPPSSLLEDAQRLKESALRARKEAQRMQFILGNGKIATLEMQLDALKAKASRTDDSNSTATISKTQQEIMDKITSLRDVMNSINEVPANKTTSNETVETMSEGTTDASYFPEEQNEVLTEKEKEYVLEVQAIVNDVQGSLEEITTTSTSSRSSTDDQLVFGELSSILADIQKDIAEPLKSGNTTESGKAVLGIWGAFKEVIGNDEDLISAVNQFKDTAANRFKDAAAQVARLEAKGEEYMIERASMSECFPVFIDPKPTLLLNETIAIEESHKKVVDNLATTILDDRTIVDTVFQRTEAPRYYEYTGIIAGIPKAKTGDDVLRLLEQELAKNKSQSEQVDLYLVRDPTVWAKLDEVGVVSEFVSDFITDEDNLFQKYAKLFQKVDDLSPTALLLVPKSITASALEPTTTAFQRTAISCIGLATMAAFAGSCYDNPDNDLLQLASSGFLDPIFAALLAIQVSHEFGHIIAAKLSNLVDKLTREDFDESKCVKLAFPPTIVPSPATGMLHTITAFTTSPNNLRVQFDVAFAGPLAGMITSWTALVVGLQQALLVPSNEIAALPHIPLAFLKVSWLTTATIQSFLGLDTLVSFDPLSDAVACHPLIIAGHIGILINGLSLLPAVPTNDGGRMLTAVFGRNSVFLYFLSGFMSIFMLLQGFRDWETCNAVLLFLFLTSVFQDGEKQDVTCRNDVDVVDGLRKVVFLASTLLALVAISPAS